MEQERKSQMVVTDADLTRLRECIEAQLGHKIHTPKDFDHLSDSILIRLHMTVSASTLKRFWGYVSSSSLPRTSTLDILANYVGHADYEAFCRSILSQDIPSSLPPSTSENGGEASTSLSGRVEEGFHPIFRKWRVSGRGVHFPRSLWLTPLVLVAVAVGVLLYFYPHRSAKDGYVLHKGQTFATPNDYLPLFGIKPDSTFWDAPLPHQEGIFVWSPQYHHPIWHNDGIVDSLCPTITEYWLPTDTSSDTISQDFIQQKNQNLLFTVMRTNELRITFMRSLHESDTAFTFLGIYRVDKQRSDKHHIVWQRIADDCNLLHLDYLQQLRN